MLDHLSGRNPGSLSDHCEIRDHCRVSSLGVELYRASGITRESHAASHDAVGRSPHAIRDLIVRSSGLEGYRFTLANKTLCDLKSGNHQLLCPRLPHTVG